MLENPSYYPDEYYKKQEKPRPDLVVWVKVPLPAHEAVEFFEGFVKAGWGHAYMPGDAMHGLQKIVLRSGS